MRKNLLDGLGDEKPELTAVNSNDAPAPARARPLGSMGAVGAVRGVLGPRPGDVVEIDTALIVPSPYRDRLSDPAADIAELVESIRASGQQVPVLLRPHQGEAGRYQIAYGHRRVAALRELGRPVRAVVRTMTDDELVVAQGMENNARKDLSFIERAMFAATLGNRQFDRATIMAALSVDKTELSRLLAVKGNISTDIVEWIGAAPKIGRRRWMQFSEYLRSDEETEKCWRLMEAERSPSVADSDARFAIMFAAVSPKRPAARKPEVWKDEAGRKLARIERSEGRLTLSIDETLEPAFGEYLLERLPEILASFKRRDGA